MNVPLVQFEALSPGWTQIRIESINVSDASGRHVDVDRHGSGKPDLYQLGRPAGWQNSCRADPACPPHLVEIQERRSICRNT